MSPITLMIWCAIVVALISLAAWAFPPRPKKPSEDIEALAARLRANRSRILEAGGRRADLDKSRTESRSESPAFDRRPRDFGKRASVPQLMITARQLEHVNIQRKLRGQSPLNRDGFHAAVSHAANQPAQPTTISDWLTYLIIYQCMFDGHTQPRVGMDTSIVINPNQPDNGCDGTFGGAGASGVWTPDVQISAEHIAAGRVDDAPVSAPYIASVSAPDPTPSSPAPSFDSSSSSSSVSVDTSPV